MYVCRILDKTVADPSVECLMIPAPSLLADPSSPSARKGRPTLNSAHPTFLIVDEKTWGAQKCFVSTLCSHIRDVKVQPTCYHLIMMILHNYSVQPQ